MTTRWSFHCRAVLLAGLAALGAMVGYRFVVSDKDRRLLATALRFTSLLMSSSGC